MRLWRRRSFRGTEVRRIESLTIRPLLSSYLEELYQSEPSVAKDVTGAGKAADFADQTGRTGGEIYPVELRAVATLGYSRRTLRCLHLPNKATHRHS